MEAALRAEIEMNAQTIQRSTAPFHTASKRVTPRWTWLLATAGLVTAIALSVATVSGHVANRSVDLNGVWPTEIRLLWLINASSALIFAVPGWYLATRRPRVIYGWLALAAALGHGLAGIGLEYAVASQLTGRDWPLATLGLWLAAWGPLVEQPVLMVAYGLYPDGRLPRDWTRWPILGSIALAVVGTLNVALDQIPGRGATVSELAGLRNPLGVPFASSSANVLPLFYAPAAIAVITVLVYRWRRARGDDRRVLAWLVAVGVPVTVVVPIAVVALPHGVGTAIAQLTTLLEVTVIVVATLRHSVYDIEVVLNRALVLTVLSTIVALAYCATVGMVSAMGTSAGVSSFVGALVAALTLLPVRTHVQHAVNRFLYGQRDEPYELLAQLATDVETVSSTDQLLPNLVATVGTALRVPYVRAEVDSGSTIERVEWGTAVDETHVFSLVHQGRRLGELVVGLRPGQGDLPSREKALLDDVTRQIAIVAETVVLTEHLRRSRERIVTAREEERRRLRMDLHDGLGPLLTGVALGLDVITESSRSNSPATARRAERLHREVVDALGEIRRLVQGLGPLRLDEAGLLGALRQLTERAQRGGMQVILVAPETAPPLSAAVEVATYRIAAEALTNVVRHSGASMCTVELSLADGVRLVIADNGRGFETGGKGTGMASMVERAEELGGSCLLTTAPEGGGRVAVHLPVADP